MVQHVNLLFECAKAAIKMTEYDYSYTRNCLDIEDRHVGPRSMQANANQAKPTREEMKHLIQESKQTKAQDLTQN